MDSLSAENEEVLRLFAIAAACIGAILTTIYSLTHGIFAVFSFLYLLPIILVVYFYPRRAVIFSLVISVTYIGIVYLLGESNLSMIAISTAWFAIFITVGVVAASYANQLVEERTRMHHVLDNSQDGIFCFDPRTGIIREINVKCAHWLDYDRMELSGKSVSIVWPDKREYGQFLEDIKKSPQGAESEVRFQAKDGTTQRFIISAVLATRERILCSVSDFTGSKSADEEIQRTLDELEQQVRARTSHLEKINEQLRAEILERRRTESTILTGEDLREEERR
jgi:PAS domain S-box-containing protein